MSLSLAAPNRAGYIAADMSTRHRHVRPILNGPFVPVTPAFEPSEPEGDTPDEPAAETVDSAEVGQEAGQYMFVRKTVTPRRATRRAPR